MATKALIVGIDFYSNGATNLSSCVNDANAWENMLTKKIKNNLSITKLISFEETDADTILEKFEILIESLEPGDVGVFIFSGHGVIKEYKCENEISCIIEERIRAQDREIPDISLINRLKELDNKAKLITIIDSCFSGGVPLEGFTSQNFPSINLLTGQILEIKTFNSNTIDNNEVENISYKNINETFSSPNKVFISACGPTEFAYAKKQQMSIFTEYSLNILDNVQETTYRMFESQIKEVLPDKDKGFNQTPYVNNGNQNPDNIFFE